MTGRFQAIQWASINAASVLAGIAGGWLAETTSYQHTFLIISIFPLAGLLLTMLLLDEPFAGIDPLILNDIKLIIRRLKERGIGIIISDHNVRDTLKSATGHISLTRGGSSRKAIPRQSLPQKRRAKFIWGRNSSSDDGY
jgi:ABC-type cobalamin transport system ATPase subunit